MNYFKSDGKFIYCEAQYIEFYLPKYYFDEKFATDLGEMIRAIGIMNVGIFSNGKCTEMKVLNVPTSVDIFVNDSEDRLVKYPSTGVEEACLVLKYNKGDKVMNSSVVEDSVNCENFVDMINKGKLPPIIPYGESIEVWKKNMELTGVNLGVPYVIYELILSAAYRYKKDQTQKFGKAAAENPGLSDYDYTMNRIREICQYTSTFTAVTYEDIDAMITTSLNRTKTKAPEAYSPVEDIIKL